MSSKEFKHFEAKRKRRETEKKGVGTELRKTRKALLGKFKEGNILRRREWLTLVKIAERLRNINQKVNLLVHLLVKYAYSLQSSVKELQQ